MYDDASKSLSFRFIVGLRYDCPHSVFVATGFICIEMLPNSIFIDFTQGRRLNSVIIQGIRSPYAGFKPSTFIV